MTDEVQLLNCRQVSLGVTEPGAGKRGNSNQSINQPITQSINNASHIRQIRFHLLRTCPSTAKSLGIGDSRGGPTAHRPYIHNNRRDDHGDLFPSCGIRFPLPLIIIHMVLPWEQIRASRRDVAFVDYRRAVKQVA